ncbi:acyltransferase [Janthinobacterium lividum]|uniref:Acyltransferase n=2 Tax=Janthinobacterium lividum TaxID=29581 RepID=A0ABU0Y255_9BURK|nr:acyltransferase [Janthinobacterium lividum]MDQ4629260.1 acyltransferase [Janthinobacterium lividum]MDQ4676333.1 acyltransferase [Janthinobacterium lividum]MDQ4688743.1 acyltransferase [Janthinobacterium lividum]QKY03139.1 acyltransferase [Janthinobacterium lividum]QKY08641.1 acyltransferase [Janthinobacterium lividum]
MSELFNPGYYTQDDLQHAGFRHVGNNVRVAKNCVIVGMENISLGNNVRIDGYSTLVAAGGGHIRIGNHVHIGGYCFLSGAAGITLDDFSGLSQGVRLYSKTDDYSGASLTNPTVPEEFTNCKSGPVHLGRHVIVGSGSVLLPDITVGEGVAVGALSLVTKSLESWGIYAGTPAKRLKNRARDLLAAETLLLEKLSSADR